MQKKVNWELIVKYLDQEVTDRESLEIEERLKTDPEYRNIIESINLTWPKNLKKEKMIEFMTDSAWDKVKKRIEQSSKSRMFTESENFASTSPIRLRLVLRIAAVLLIAAGLSFAAYKVWIQSGRVSQDILTVQSGPDRMIEAGLPDGSTVFVKANGQVTYDLKKTGVRSVQLEGEAFFDVVHVPDQAFQIETQQAMILVVGTSFSVHCDETSNRVHVFVESGNVLLSDKLQSGRSLIIEPGYIGTLSPVELKKEINLNDNYLAWKTGKLVFREARLSKVIDDLNRTYTSQVIHGDTKISNCKFTGTFYNQPVDSVLEALGIVFKLNIEKTNAGIFLSGDGCQ